MKQIDHEREQWKMDAIGCRLRSDIVWTCHRENGALEPSWIAHAPLTRHIFRCGEQEYQILHWLHDNATTADIVKKFYDAFAPRSIEPFELQKLIARCIQSGVLRSAPAYYAKPATSQAESCMEFFPETGLTTVPLVKKPTVDVANTNWAHSVMRWLVSVVGKLTQFQVSLGSPDRWLGTIAPWFHWIYSGSAVCFWFSFVSLAVVLVGLRFDEFMMELPSFQSLRSPSLLIGFGVVFALTRVVHEMGHAIVCKRSGAACKDMGLIVSFGMLCPFVDITDAWRIGNRFVRMGIALAGIYTEAIVAGVAAFVWLGTHPGGLHTCAMQTMLVCSVTTLLFNANPLMKYDGYFVLCDLLGTQNLRERSFQSIDSMIAQDGRRESFGMSCFLSIYFLGSTLNRIIVACGMVALVTFVASQWQLTGLGIGLIVLYACCSAIIAMGAWTVSAQTRRPRENVVRAAWLGWTTVALLIAWIVNMPLPNRVHALGKFQFGARQPVYATISGRLESSIDCSTSVLVERDSVIVQLSNEAMTRNVMDLESRLLKLELQLKTLDRLAYFDDRASASKPMLQSQFEFVLRQLSQKREEVSRLGISTPGSGSGLFEPAIAKPAETPENPTEFALGFAQRAEEWAPAFWTEAGSLGRWVERGTLIGWFVHDDVAKVECRLAEEQTAGIRIGSEVRIRLEQRPDKCWIGNVVEIAKMSQSSESVPSVKTSAESIDAMAYQVRIEFVDHLSSSEYIHGNAEVVLLRPSQSLLKIATDQWLRHARMR